MKRFKEHLREQSGEEINEFIVPLLSSGARAALTGLKAAKNLKIGKKELLLTALSGLGSYGLSKLSDRFQQAQSLPGTGVEGGVGGNIGYVSSLAGKRFDVVDVPKSYVHDVVYR
jgi:hypothetical protein